MKPLPLIQVPASPALSPARIETLSEIFLRPLRLRLAFASRKRQLLVPANPLLRIKAFEDELRGGGPQGVALAFFQAKLAGERKQILNAAKLPYHLRCRHPLVHS